MIDEKELQVTEGFLKSVEDLLDNRGAIVTPWIRTLIAEVRRLREREFTRDEMETITLALAKLEQRERDRDCSEVIAKIKRKMFAQRWGDTELRNLKTIRGNYE